MEGEGSYLKRQSYSSTPSKNFSNYTTASSPSQKSQYRYSTGEYPKTSSRISRRYATPEESDAVFPIFNTPTNMYLRKELNPQQRYAPTSQQQPVYNNSPSSTAYHSKPTYNGSSFDPLLSKASTASPMSNGTSSFSSTSSTSSTKDLLLAQLVDMGFSLEASRVAMAASGNNNLQDVLDILVQNEKAEKASTTPHQGRRTSSSSDEDQDPQSQRQSEEIWRRQQEERRREYLEQLKRNKPTPPKPKKQGNYYFNKGQFSESESAYTLAINSLPVGHGDVVLLSNNRAAARLKQGKYQDCLTDCSTAIDVARKHMQNNLPISPIMSATSTNMKAQLIKALHRKACALEGLRLFEAAIQVYEEYVRLDGSRSAQVTQGIMRCQQALLDSKKKQQQQSQWKPATSANDATTAFPDIDFNMFIPKKDQKTQAQLDEINNSKAVKEMRDREKKKEAEDAERLENEDKVNAQISVWKTGKDKNLRALLGSLELILWPGVQWKGVMMSELLDPRKCKLTYMKAIAKVHPDKLPANATVEQRMLASDTNDFSDPYFNPKKWINSVLKPATPDTPKDQDDDGGAKNTTILVTKLQIASDATSRQFDQLSSTVIKSMPRILYDLKVISDDAKSTHQGVEAVKKNLGLLEGDTEAALEKLRRPHIAKTRMEECRMLLLEKSDHLNKIKEEQERKKQAAEAEAEAAAKLLEEEHPTTAAAGSEHPDDNNSYLQQISDSMTPQVSNVFKRIGVPVSV
ncbi:hypothetical protein FB192DRAFT_1270892 [Mucor lusitanicus]|uniref:UBA domain-containing protein n=1 Tax=Mucor circinelloides f. lusitanicus TaxID=29924 RepID=A0A8H4BSD0_MUCCL|nr:hypothetical protein FB192DRAFT_1270892 [Mucor lusitanicus]